LTRERVQPLDQVRLEAAAQWWVRLQGAESPVDDVSAWFDWLETERENREAYLRIQELSLRLQATAQVKARRSSLRWDRRVGALAASMLIMTVGAAVLWRMHIAMQRPSLTLSTPIAALEQAPLPDGSIVSLGGATSLKAIYTEALRDIRLEEGEAFFEVHHERSQRPFVVNAGPVAIQALGTAFNVRKTGQRVTVTVTEGGVQMSRVGAVRGTVAVATGEQATYDPRSDRFQVVAVDTDRALAWRERRLEFVDEPLDAVIANVNRYSPRHIEVRDVNLHSHFYTGTFHPDKLEEWLIAIERAFPIDIHSSGERVIIESHR